MRVREGGGVVLIHLSGPHANLGLGRGRVRSLGLRSSELSKNHPGGKDDWADRNVQSCTVKAPVLEDACRMSPSVTTPAVATRTNTLMPKRARHPGTEIGRAHV